uniref:G-protein coupled receptors family 1 profile domain-containing protein n=1 Tax=Biomphalaria glabrata TaxID=6526 RepID=A0A2C9LAQ9_BIOGL
MNPNTSGQHVLLDVSITFNLKALVATSVVLIVVNLFTLISNSVIVLSLVKFYAIDHQWTRKGNAIPILLMTSLACTDLLIAVCVMPFNVVEMVYNGKWTLSKLMCTARYEVSHLLSIASVLHVTCMALDRFLAVTKPFQYRPPQKRFGIPPLCASWIIPIAVAILPTINHWHQQGLQDVLTSLENSTTCTRFFNRTFLITTISISLYAPLAATYILYAAILVQIIKNVKKRKSLLTDGTLRTKSKTKVGADVKMVELISTTSSSYSCTVNPKFTISTSEALTTVQDNVITERHAKRSSSLESGKAYRTIGCILLCLSACYFPVVMVTTVYSYDTMKMPMWLATLMGWLPLLSSTLNPIIYCSSLTVRRALHHFYNSSSSFFS